ncbi:hypothetical protein [Escherichia phage PH1062]|nr:hypothetical protein [Escherichia phage PH1062]
MLVKSQTPPFTMLTGLARLMVQSLSGDFSQ